MSTHNTLLQRLSSLVLEVSRTPGEDSSRMGSWGTEAPDGVDRSEGKLKRQAQIKEGHKLRSYNSTSCLTLAWRRIPTGSLAAAVEAA